MKKNHIILFGNGGHAKSCVDVIEQDGIFEIAGLIAADDQQIRDIYGYQTLGTDSQIAFLSKKYRNAFVAVGQTSSPIIRVSIFNQLKENGFEIPTIISPRAYVSRNAVIGVGTIVMHGAIINSGAIVGDNCIINSHSLIEHDAKIGDHCHISTHAVVNGNTIIGDKTFVGSGSVLRNNLVIGASSFIGMGVSVTSNLPSNSVLKNVN